MRYSWLQQENKMCVVLNGNPCRYYGPTTTTVNFCWWHFWFRLFFCLVSTEWNLCTHLLKPTGAQVTCDSLWQQLLCYCDGQQTRSCLFFTQWDGHRIPLKTWPHRETNDFHKWPFLPFTVICSILWDETLFHWESGKWLKFGKDNIVQTLELSA